VSAPHDRALADAGKETHMVGAAHENSVNTADYWLARADSVRAAAKVTDDLRVRRHLLGSAQGYEKIAREVAANPTARRTSIERDVS
jgi:hypothetical protein